MQRIGHRLTWLIAGLLAAGIPALWMWGFTVDDALIPVRYARHLASGSGWRFDADGPSTDGVTPLPWPAMLAPLARAPALVVLARAKALGLVAWCAAGAALGDGIGHAARAPAWARAGALAVLALSVPVAAHAVSGMETAVATSLATFAVLQARRPRVVAVLAGLAASLRPEMAPWACVLSAGLGIAAGGKTPRVATLALLALLPFACCALVRVLVWGRPAPLALWAKPGDLEQGLAYAGAACVVTLTPILAVAPLALRRTPVALAIVVAALAHLAAVAAVGGDWMPYSRLAAPIAPGLAFAAVLAAEHATPLATAVRTTSAAALGILLVARGGTSGRSVGADRGSLIAEARPLLADVHRVAALDIGWVGAATEADIVDLAGLTNPEIAMLPGGHTSKRVDSMFLLSREPDALLLYFPDGLPDASLDAWQRADYSHFRTVELRLANDEVIARHFAPTAWLPLGTRGAGYVLLHTTP